MLTTPSREERWSRIEGTWDVLVVGGGITGAGVLHRATRLGLRALLLERNDFASGTSSRSSKLVHGGLRYLKEGRITLTRESVRERQRLLRDLPGLVEPMPFLMPHYPGRKPGRAVLGAGLAVYDLLAGAWQHRFVDAEETARLEPGIRRERLLGAHCYTDATTDDARLVLRVLQEARDAGAEALARVDVTEIMRANGTVAGATVVDRETGRTAAVRARIVINATGAQADALRGTLGATPKLRPLRGSHLVLANWRLPVSHAVAFDHPRDGRPVFAYPWSAMTLVGTTDLDEHGDLRCEPRITHDEVAYLLEALDDMFPESAITHDDIVSTYAGVRPVVASGASDPSKEGRDQLLLDEDGFITITGGKLTTFRPMADAALAAAMRHLGGTRTRAVGSTGWTRAATPNALRLSSHAAQRLAGRYGTHAQRLVREAHDGELAPIAGTDTLWAELRYAAAHEDVVHLDDLLLRRTRLGLCLRDGGLAHAERIAAICADELGWDASRWNSEAASYAQAWQIGHGVPRG